MKKKRFLTKSYFIQKRHQVTIYKMNNKRHCYSYFQNATSWQRDFYIVFVNTEHKHL